jgi:hypothetical protein
MSERDKNALEIFAPKIQAIQDHLNRIAEYLRRNQSIPALREMVLCIYELDPPDQPRELLDKIIMELKRLSRHRYASGRNKQLDLSQWKYMDWLQQLHNAIWGSGYFDAKKWKDFVDLTGGKPRR